MEPAVMLALLWAKDRLEPERYISWSLYWYRWCGGYQPEGLGSWVKGVWFRSPIGAAAGLDPKANHLQTLEHLGFGFLELGSLTMDREVAKPSSLHFDFSASSITRTAQTASCGAFQFCRNVARDQPGVPIGANLVPTSSLLLTVPYLSDKDYTNLIEVVYPYADYMVANIASDAVTDLSQYRSESHLRILCREMIRARDLEIGLQCALETGISGVSVIRARRLIPPLFVKVDADWEDAGMLAKVLVEEGVDGVVIAGTNRKGEGGKPVAEASLKLLREVYRQGRGRLVIVAAGGIFTAEDVLTRIKSGASLVEIYSAFWLLGPYIVKNLSSDLHSLLQKEGFRSVSAAVGVDVNHKGSR